jgi:hypothetical protein
MLLILLLALMAVWGSGCPLIASKKAPHPWTPHSFMPGTSPNAEDGASLPPPPPAIDTSTPSPAVTYWRQKYPQYQLVKWAPGFLTGDDQEDAVIIYRTGAKCSLVAVIALPGGGFQATDPLPAPVSDQQITVGDVENKNLGEIIVSGQKDGAYGYAIFALDKNQLLTLYSAGMDQCC